MLSYVDWKERKAVAADFKKMAHGSSAKAPLFSSV
jgi:hypothetical protein